MRFENYPFVSHDLWAKKNATYSMGLVVLTMGRYFVFPMIFFVRPIGSVFRLMVLLSYTHGICEDQPMERKI